MKKLLIAVFILLSFGAFAQDMQKNGTIYKEHPYITAVNNSMAFFLKQDWDGMAKLYSDTVKFYDPSTPKPYGLTDAKKDGWMFTMAGNKSALPSKAILMGYNMTKIHSRYNHGGQ